MEIENIKKIIMEEVDLQPSQVNQIINILFRELDNYFTNNSNDIIFEDGSMFSHITKSPKLNKNDDISNNQLYLDFVTNEENEEYSRLIIHKKREKNEE